MLMTIDPTRKDRTRLRLTIVAFSIAVAWVIIHGVMNLWAAMTRGALTVVLRPPFDPVVRHSPHSVVQEQREVLHLQVTAAPLSGPAVTWLRVSDHLEMIWLGHIISLGGRVNRAYRPGPTVRPSLPGAIGCCLWCATVCGCSARNRITHRNQYGDH